MMEDKRKKNFEGEDEKKREKRLKKRFYLIRELV